MLKTFKQQMPTLDPKVLMIVDSLNTAFRWKHSGAQKFVKEYQQTIESLRKSYHAAKVIIACDQGSSSYRKELYPEYKQNRKDKQETQTEQEAEDFRIFFEEFKQVIAAYQEQAEYPVVKFDGVEADDCAAYITAKAIKLGYRVVLISTDRDWDLLIRDSVMRFSYVTRKETTLDNWNEHYEYSPDDHISIKCLTGDSGDNIPGVTGIGPKKAHALVREFGSTYDIIASLPISSRYKHIANLNEFGADALLLNYKLMDLVSHCEEAIGASNCQTLDQTLERYL